MEDKIKELIDFYEKEINEANEELSFFENGNDRIETLIFAYNSILQKLKHL